MYRYVRLHLWRLSALSKFLNRVFLVCDQWVHYSAHSMSTLDIIICFAVWHKIQHKQLILINLEYLNWNFWVTECCLHSIHVLVYVSIHWYNLRISGLASAKYVGGCGMQIVGKHILPKTNVIQLIKIKIITIRSHRSRLQEIIILCKVQHCNERAAPADQNPERLTGCSRS